MPAFALGGETVTLPVQVARGAASVTRFGAIVIQPRAVLQIVTPPTGPPEGGSTVNLYGVGLNSRLMVSFGSNRAGDLKLRSSGHLEVRAPAGSFGFADIVLESPLFGSPPRP